MFRVRPHGNIYTWWCIQEKRWWRWNTVAKYFDTREIAEAELDALNASDARQTATQVDKRTGRW